MVNRVQNDAPREGGFGVGGGRELARQTYGCRKPLWWLEVGRLGPPGLAQY